MESKFHGTYAIRKAAHGEQVIHMPQVVSGTFAIYERDDGVVELVPMGKKAGAP